MTTQQAAVFQDALEEFVADALKLVDRSFGSTRDIERALPFAKRLELAKQINPDGYRALLEYLQQVQQ